MTTTPFYMKTPEQQGREMKRIAYAAGILKVGEEFTCEECGEVVEAHTVTEVDNVWCDQCLDDYEEADEAGEEK